MQSFSPLREVPLRRELEDAIRTVDVVLAQSQTIRDLLDLPFPGGQRRLATRPEKPVLGPPRGPVVRAQRAEGLRALC